MKTNICIFSLFFLLFLSAFTFAQDVYVQGNGDRAGYYRSRPDDTVNNNYSTKGNVNPYTGKPGTKPRQGVVVNYETGAYGTGEFVLVPAIVRSDPKGTAARFNTCGTGLVSLLDRDALGGLTDPNKQVFNTETVFIIAESRFRMATEYDADNYVYHTNLALILFRQNKDEEALSSILKAIELSPKDERLREYEALIRREKTTVRILDDVEDK